ncbi:hypothetical protein [Stutzerimonas azotifigens]|uniref:hypothetical protein n=1 Tax=Stutzerimonas azotifigens TaxID=291995 RepID=UPI000425B081|nr:hypothetical protein [Stutzerimonas azotifigens]
MKPQTRQLRGDEIPDAWRPAWEVCWVVELDGKVVAGPYASQSEAQAVADSEKRPDEFQTPLR